MDLIHDLDEKSLNKIIKSNLVNFIKPADSESQPLDNFFSSFTPFDYKLFVSQNISFEDEMFEKMEKKFNMMLNFYDFFTRFHLFFEIDFALKDSGELFDHELDIYRKNIF